MTRLIATVVLLLIFHPSAIAQETSEPLSIGETISFFSSILNETRQINIYLPANYSADDNDTINYPIVYVLDGGINEDFFHIAGLVQFSSQPWVDRLPRSIVVGIGGNNRRRDFTFSVKDLDFIEKERFEKSDFPQYGGSEKFICFIEEELLPLINDRYRTTKQNTIIGESLAGLLATEILCKKPELFDRYVIISPSLWWGERQLLDEGALRLDESVKKNTAVYLGIPNKNEDLRMYRDAETLFELLRQNKKINVIFDYLPDESHATILHQAVYKAFKKLANDKR